VKAAEMPRHQNTDQQGPDRNGKDIAGRSQVKIPNARYEKIPDGAIEKSPQNIHHR
jgi:hypothetical protein